MSIRQPIAFMSYVRSDDQHEGGRITKFRERLEGEVRMQTGRPFAIFQDRNDIQWGQQWEERISQSLADVTFLIPIITPSFFESPACLNEFKTFLLREKTLGLDRLILPVIYTDCDQLESEKTGEDAVADIIKKRNWTDWRALRFKSFDDQDVLSALANMAKMIKTAMQQLDAIIVKSRPGDKVETQAVLIERAVQAEPAVSKSSAETYFVPEVRSSDSLDIKKHKSISKNDYYVYTRRYDEAVRAQELAEPGELMRLYRYLSRATSKYEIGANKVLTKITNQIMNMATPPSIAVTLLLDNSGSMRGEKIIALASSALLLIGWLEKWQIRTEVLGFTTRTWKGGQSRELWLSDGKPALPGRLNDLRHIIYKDFDEPAQSAAPSVGIMAREGLLKENIDGEALLWAYSRLIKQKSAKKILIVITDGAPVDDSTISVQSKHFLLDHFRSVVKTINDEKKVTLKLVGIDYDMSAYTSDAIEVNDLKIAAPVLNFIGMHVS